MAGITSAVHRVNSIGLRFAARVDVLVVANTLCETFHLTPEDIVAVQRLENGIVIVKLASEAVFEDLLRRYEDSECQSARIGVGVTVLNYSLRTEYVSVREAPVEMADDVIKSVLERYGKVLGWRRAQYRGGFLNGKDTGVRTFRMVIRSPIPSMVTVAGCKLRFLYEGQLRTCFRCGAPGHMAAACGWRMDGGGGGLPVARWAGVRHFGGDGVPDGVRRRDVVAEVHSDMAGGLGVERERPVPAPRVVLADIPGARVVVDLEPAAVGCVVPPPPSVCPAPARHVDDGLLPPGCVGRVEGGVVSAPDNLLSTAGVAVSSLGGGEAPLVLPCGGGGEVVAEVDLGGRRRSRSPGSTVEGTVVDGAAGLPVTDDGPAACLSTPTAAMCVPVKKRKSGGKSSDEEVMHGRKVACVGVSTPGRILVGESSGEDVLTPGQRWASESEGLCGEERVEVLVCEGVCEEVPGAGDGLSGVGDGVHFGGKVGGGSDWGVLEIDVEDKLRLKLGRGFSGGVVDGGGIESL